MSLIVYGSTVLICVPITLKHLPNATYTNLCSSLSDKLTVPGKLVSHNYRKAVLND